MSRCGSPSPARRARSARRRSTSSAPRRTATRSSPSASARRSTSLIAQAQRVPPEGRRRRRRQPRAPRSPRRCRSPRSSPTSPTWSTTPTSWSTASSASPACRSPIATLRAGKRLALANKESLIAAGPVVQPLRATPGAELVPVDSEHCAVHQCLRCVGRRRPRGVAGSCSPPAAARSAAAPPTSWPTSTVDEALAHPTWSMGPKITIDSSTLMNKGLEVIEAHELFGTPYDQIEVVVHPQSVVHSMVEFTDGVDDRPALHARHAPADRLRPGLPEPHRARRSGASTGRRCGRLDFEPPDRATFRCLALAYEAGRVGGTAPAWLSAANEVAVEAFLAGRIRWTQIADVCDAALQRMIERSADRTVDDVIDADAACTAGGHGGARSRELTRTTKFRNEVMAGGADSRRARADRRAAPTACIAHRPSSSALLVAARHVRASWAFVFVVGLLISIFLHELGHFVTARLDRDEGHPVLPRFGPEAVELPARRDRVRRAGAARSAPSCGSSG